MKSQPIIREATQEDVHTLAVSLREEDRLELWHFNRSTPAAELQYGFENGETYVVVAGNELIAMFGVVEEADNGRVWLVGTNNIKRIFRLHRYAHEALRLLLAEYGTLTNYVWLENRTHVRWLQWLGFTFGQEQIINGERFASFSMTNEQAS